MDIENLTTTTNSNGNDDSAHDLHMRIVGYLELVALIIGAPLNCLVIYVSARLAKKHQSNNNLWIVLSMTIADLIFTLFHCSLMFGRWSLGAIYDESACMLLYITTYVSTIASSLSLLMLNGDKFIYLHKPLHYFMIVTKRKIAIGITVCWLVSIAWSLFFILGPMTDHKAPPCEFYSRNLALYIVFLMLFFTVPILLSLLVSCYIGIIVIRTKEANRERQLVSIAHANSFQNGHTRQKSVSGSGYHSHLRSIVFVFSTTISSALTSLPYRISYFVYKTSGMQHSDGSVALFYYLFFLMSMNPVMNPMITIVTQRQYKLQLKAMWQKWTGGTATEWSTEFFTTASHRRSSDLSNGSSGALVVLCDPRAGRKRSGSNQSVSSSEAAMKQKLLVPATVPTVHFETNGICRLASEEQFTDRSRF